MKWDKQNINKCYFPHKISQAIQKAPLVAIYPWLIQTLSSNIYSLWIRHISIFAFFFKKKNTQRVFITTSNHGIFVSFMKIFSYQGL